MNDAARKKSGRPINTTQRSKPEARTDRRATGDGHENTNQRAHTRCRMSRQQKHPPEYTHREIIWNSHVDKIIIFWLSRLLSQSLSQGGRKTTCDNKRDKCWASTTGEQKTL